MRDSKSQRCVQQHKALKVTRNATNYDKHVNEASKQYFANNLFKISCKYTQGMHFNWKVCFNALNIQMYDEPLCILKEINETVQRMTVLPCQFDVNKLQKQLRSLIQIHLDQSTNFGPLLLNECVIVRHNVAFNSINR